MNLLIQCWLNLYICKTGEWTHNEKLAIQQSQNILLITCGSRPVIWQG